MAKIKIVTDSTSDIPKNLAEELGIEVLPLTLTANGKEYRDGIDITPEEFYKILDTSEEIPASSCVAPALYTELYERVYEEGYTDLILTSINSKGSSTYQGSVMTKEMFYEDHPEAVGKFNIHNIDSQTYSMSYGWAVVEAARKANEGASVEDIIAGIMDWVENTRPMFVPMTLKFVKKSGRVSAAAAFVGDALGLKPVITFENGESKVVSKIRGEKKVVKELLGMVKSERKPGTPYMIVYGNNDEQFSKLRDTCTEVLGDAPELEYPVGCVIGINTGPNIVGIIYRR
ncbi:MAG: DegV family protein [Clostridia bacterium]|nr:DegV family protein [Clostridia bacterium]